jgi:PAS domain S-box-containing protein
VVEAQTELISRFRPDGTHIFVNEAYCRYFGKTAPEILGTRFHPAVSAEDKQAIRRHLDSLTPEHPEATLEHAVLMPDGNVRWQQWNDRAIFDATGQVREFQSVGRDISERKNAELVLVESEKKYRSLLEGLYDSILVHRDKKILYLNPACEKVLGYSRDALLNQSIMILVPPEFHEMVQSAVRKRMAGETFEPYELDLIRGDGSRISVIMSGKLVEFEGAPASINLITDISARKRAEQALQESEKRFRELANLLPQVIYEVDLDGNLTYANQTAFERFGYTDNDFIQGHNIVQMLAPIDLKRAMTNFRAIIEGKGRSKYSGEYMALRKDGSTFPVAIYSSPIVVNGRITGIRGIIIDITERMNAENELKSAYERITADEEELRIQYGKLQQSEEELRASETLYRTILNNTGSATIIIEEDTTISFVNPEFERIMGYSKKEVEGKKSWTEVVFPEDTEQMSRYHHLRRTNPDKAPRNYEFRVITKDRQIRNVYITIGVIPGTKRTVASFIDITENKHTEEALKESERKYRSILENIQDAYYRSDRDGNLIMINPSGVRLLGYSSENEILGRNIAHTIYTDPSQRQIFLQTLEKDGRINNYEVLLNRCDGTSVPVETSSHKFYDEDGNFLGVEGIVRDITKRKQTIEALASANRKLKLLSGITRHDINNQLSIMKGFLALLEKKQPDTSFSEDFKKINTSAQRISSMIEFTKEYEEIGVNAPVWLDCRILFNTAAKHISLGRVMVKNDLPAGTEVFADPLMVKVFYNLVDNAVRYGGKITTLRISIQESGDNLVIVCEDDGDGVPVEDKKQIFEQGIGKNTGLGLFLTREILGITGITIIENGVPGNGARFEITVPQGQYRLV